MSRGFRVFGRCDWQGCNACYDVDVAEPINLELPPVPLREGWGGVGWKTYCPRHIVDAQSAHQRELERMQHPNPVQRVIPMGSNTRIELENNIGAVQDVLQWLGNLEFRMQTRGMKEAAESVAAAVQAIESALRELGVEPDTIVVG